MTPVKTTPKPPRKKKGTIDSGSGAEAVNAPMTVPSSNAQQQQHEEESTFIEIQSTQQTSTKKNMNHVTIDAPNYFQVLQAFDPHYPIRTDICCWWCCHSFTTPPIGVPRKYDKETKMYHVIGCFCSFNCAMAYAMDEKKSVHCESSLLVLLYSETLRAAKLEQCLPRKIRPAPTRICLDVFGGPLSIHEFRRSFASDVNVSLYQLPMIPWLMWCELVGVSPSLSSSSSRTHYNSNNNNMNSWSSASMATLEIRKAKPCRLPTDDTNEGVIE